MIIRIPDQYVCAHRAQLAFKKAQGALGAVYEITCDKDSECPNQPDRSKREDLDCCKKVKNLESICSVLHSNFSTIDGSENIEDGSHDATHENLFDILQEYKMRCSEHKG